MTSEAVYPSLKLALPEVADGALVFAEEYDTTKDKRQFVVTPSAERYFERFKRMHPFKRRVHEVLQFDKPCRLVLDIETTSVANSKTVVLDAINDMRAIFGAELRTIILDSSRYVKPDVWKSSYHVIFPDVVLETPSHVCAYVYERLKTPERYFVDMSIYRTRGNLRTAYSRSLHSDVHLTPVGVPKDAPIDPQTFFDSLASVPGATVNTQPEAAVVPKHVTARAVSDEYQARALHAIEEFVLAKYADVPTLSVDTNCNSPFANQVSIYVGGVECPFARRVHASNRMIFSITLMPRELVDDVSVKWRAQVGVRWMCLDESCRGCFAGETEADVRSLASAIYN